MRKKLCLAFLAILCVILSLGLSVNASTPVIYLSGSGSDSNNGLSSTKPVATLGKAVALLNGGGGTVVLCGNVTENTGLTIPAQSEELYITSSYGGVNYNATLSFGLPSNQANKNLYFTSETTIDHLKINYNIHSTVTDKLLMLYSGRSLTIGENVQVTRTNESSSVSTTTTQVAIRGGVYEENIAETQIRVASGAYRYILAGNSSATVGNSSITVSGTTKIYDFIQCGGVTAAVDNTVLAVTGGDIKTIYVDGYDKAMTSCTVDITGGLIGEITDKRASATNISSALTISVSDKSLSNIGLIDLKTNHTATKTLNLIGSSPADEAYVEFISAAFSDWDEVNITADSTIYLNTVYSAPQTSLFVEDGSNLVLTENTSLPPGVANVSLGSQVVFLDPFKGKDTNNGRSPAAPVATWSKAMSALNGKGGTLVVCNDVVVVQGSTSTTTIQQSLPQLSGLLTITGCFNGVSFEPVLSLGGANNNAQIILCSVTPTVIKDVTIRYHRPNASDTTAEIWSGQSLTIGENVSVTATGTNNQITLRTGNYSSVAANATLSVMSGSWNYVQGGNSRNNVTVSNLHFGGDAVAQYVQCGGTNSSVGTSNANISGGTIMNALYANGYGTSGKSASMGTSNITISGGNIEAIYDARNTYSPITGSVTLTYIGDGVFGVAAIDLKKVGVIAGKKNLKFSETPCSITHGNFKQWDTVTIQDDSNVYIKTKYAAPVTSLKVQPGCGLYLYTGTNTALPSYSGGGTVSLTETITRTTDQLTETLYMPLAIPERDDGTDTDKEQGMAVWGDELFVFHNDGVCKVYDLVTRSSTPICTFNIGSYNTGVPTANYSNHCNTTMFSDYYYTDPVTGLQNDIPLLFVRTGNGFGADSNGYYARLSIENVVRTVNPNGSVSFSTQVLQTIIYSDYYDGNKTINDYNAAHGTSYVKAAGFGAPMWLVDSSDNAIYILSAKYRTTYGSVGDTANYPGYYTVDDNYYVVTKFNMTDWAAGGTVILTPKDIQDQFTTELAAFSTQGGTLHDGKIIYTFGFGQIAAYNPGTILVFDLEEKRISDKIDLSRSMLAFEELEGCAVYNGKLLTETQNGYLYELDINGLLS